jgi:hypothetical protein
MQNAVTSQAQDFSLSIHHLSTYSDDSTWTETHTGSSPWSSYMGYIPGNDSNTESNDFVQATGTEENITYGTHALNTREPLPSNIAYITPLESSAEISLSQSFNEVEKTFDYSDDPFMGWASKRASHNLDDYGWVLSHVENL